MLTKKKRILKAIKLNPNISLKSIFQIGRKQHPTYLSAIKELKEKNYKNAEHWSIELKGKKPNAWYIRGEIHLRQGNYNDAVRDLIASIKYNAKIANLYMMIGISYYKNNNNKDALKYFDIVLQNDPNNHLCLKYCAYIYEKKKIFSNTLKMLGKLLSINEEDSLILCYYGETLSKIGKQYIIKKYTQPGITNDFDLYMYNAKGVYFMSNLMNLNYNCQFQGSTNLNSYIIFKAGDNAIFTNRRHKLKHKDILKLEGLGWILYVSFHSVYIDYRIQLSIETSNSIDMQIEYVQITKDYHKELPKMDHSLPLYTNNIPETFKKKYFLRKETENLLELKDIIDY
ncbi:hypothetical protein GLOIN_2v1812174 [Rhizophagus irregularis DAOM 181602=DAOM 197198]|nr:hypothetical protein GLOIN_2v1812174 [Rhizophagus irregularis DAOM 181602=DAOM 197198]